MNDPTTDITVQYRSRRRIGAIILVVIVGLSRFSLGAAYNDEYGVLSERNIFLRDRVPEVEPGVEPGPAGPTVPIEELFAVTGIVAEKDAYRAFVEEVGAGKVHEVRAGDRIADGAIERIELDALVYTARGSSARVSIGDNLAGKPFDWTLRTRALYEQQAASRDAPETAAAQPQGGSASPGSLEEQMRYRRQQQLTQQK